ncbi:unnamed protein product [Parnassius apollo]|uniref:(apollo) hypothetical protein n=1 Tax=Parnassius apollo TaxID=110799 RepID=A0A8S3XSI2_PARAO|nr:unnamed protein product [Parnassius apollo]
MFRGNHPPQHLGSRHVTTPMENNVKEKKSGLVTQSSLRMKQRTKAHDSFNETQEAVEVPKSEKEKRLSNSVDAIITKRDTKSKVICSAKGLLETNLDDLFNDLQKLDGWTGQSKSLGASEPSLSVSDKNIKAATKRESLVSEDDTADDTATNSDCIDQEAREQRKCMGARRIGHILRRVISRNGKFHSHYFDDYIS